MSAAPSVFVSHGSPMHALQPGPAGEAWKALGYAVAAGAILGLMMSRR